MGPLHYAFPFLRGISKVLAILAGFAVFVLAFLIGIDIVTRKFLGFSVQGTDEIGGYVLAAVAGLGFSHVLFERGFTRIDLLVSRFNRNVTYFLNVAAYASLAAVAVFFADRSIATYRDTILFDARANTPLQTPMWIPQGLWTAGMCFFAFCAVLYALRAVVLLFVDRDALNAEFGAVAIEEEVNEIAELSLDANARADRGAQK